MTSVSELRTMLAGGKANSIGRADEVVLLCEHEPARIAPLVRLLCDSDAAVRMRAANALEKLSRTDATRLQRHKAAFIALAGETKQPALRWSVALMVPRLKLTHGEVLRFADVLRAFLQDESSIVKTFAMQGLANLVQQAPELRAEVLDTVRMLTRSGTPAMRARGRHLLKRMEKDAL